MNHHCCNDHQPPAMNVAEADGPELALIDDLIAAMDRPGAIIEEIAVGAHFIGIRADDDGTVRAGLASTLGAAPSEDEKQKVSELQGKTLAEAARWLKSAGGFCVSLGAAALNTGIIAPENQPGIEASLIMADKGKTGETVLIGEFPFTEWLRGRVETLHLLELQETRHRVPPEQWDVLLGRCRVLGLTGTTLITRAMATYLKKAPQAYRLVIGPTTPMTPALFAHGVDMLAGSRVADPGPVFAGIRKGLHFRQIKPLGIEFIAWAKSSGTP